MVLAVLVREHMVVVPSKPRQKVHGVALPEILLWIARGLLGVEVLPNGFGGFAADDGGE